MERQETARVRKAARWRAGVAFAFAPISFLVMLVLLDGWKASVMPAFVWGIAHLVQSALFIVTGFRALGVARRGGQIERSAAVDRALGLIGMVLVLVMVMSALSALGRVTGIAVAVSAVVTVGVLWGLQWWNWKAPSLEGPLQAQLPVGARRR